MRHLKLSWVLLASTLVLTGCSSNTKPFFNLNQSHVWEYYTKSKSLAVKLTPIILKSLETGNTNFGNISWLSSLSTVDWQSSFKSGIHLWRGVFKAYYNFKNAQSSIPSTGVTSIPSLSSLIESSISVHYFLNGGNGELEQLIIATLPNGYIGYLGLLWLGGSVVEVKSFNIS